MMLPNLSGLSLHCRPCGEAFERFDDAQGSAPAQLPNGRPVPDVTIKDGAECAVCSEDLEDKAWGKSSNTRDVEALFETCGHVFHVECLGQWIEKGGRRCPLCRTPIAQEVLDRFVEGAVEEDDNNAPNVQDDDDDDSVGSYDSDDGAAYGDLYDSDEQPEWDSSLPPGYGEDYDYMTREAPEIRPVLRRLQNGFEDNDRPISTWWEGWLDSVVALNMPNQEKINAISRFVRGVLLDNHLLTAGADITREWAYKFTWLLVNLNLNTTLLAATSADDTLLDYVTGPTAAQKADIKKLLRRRA